MKLFPMVRALSERNAHTRQRNVYRGIYDRYKEYSMTPESFYFANLSLVSRFSNVNGSIVECGTWKGGMIAGIADLLGTQREYCLYDSFEGLPVAKDIDGESAVLWQSDTSSPYYYDNCTASQQDAEKAMELAGVTTAKIHKGWFESTLPNSEFPNGISILRMDADWYESTMTILVNLFEHVNVGGCVIIDDYHTWDGCSKAVHDYLSKHQRSEKINTHDNIVAFIVKC